MKHKISIEEVTGKIITTVLAAESSKGGYKQLLMVVTVGEDKVEYVAKHLIDNKTKNATYPTTLEEAIRAYNAF